MFFKLTWHFEVRDYFGQAAFYGFIMYLFVFETWSLFSAIV